MGSLTCSKSFKAFSLSDLCLIYMIAPILLINNPQLQISPYWPATTYMPQCFWRSGSKPLPQDILIECSLCRDIKLWKLLMAYKLTLYQTIILVKTFLNDFHNI